MNLRAKILFLLIPLIVIPLLTLGWTAYRQLRETTIQRSMVQMTNLIDQVRIHIDYHLQMARANIDIFSHSSLLEKYITTEDEAERLILMQPTILRLFNSYQKAYPEYYEIRILLPNGHEDTRSVVGDIPNTTEEESEARYFAELQRYESKILTTFIENPDNQETALLIIKPLIYKDRSVFPVITPPALRGYLVITINLDYLKQQTSSIQIGEQGYLFATDHTGKVLFHPNAARIGHSLPSAEFSQLQRTTEHENPMRIRLHENNVYAHGSRLHANLYLYAILPEYELLASSRRLGRIVGVIILGATLLTLLLIYAALNSFVLRPIKQLGSAVNEIGEGNLLTHIDVESNDEIGTLAKSFMEMGKNLYDSQEQTQFLAYHDNLTGLPNRLMFKEIHQLALAEAKRHQHMSALMYLDLDDFKRINDSLGHQAGDVLLKKISQRLLTVLRGEDCLTLVKKVGPEDMVARIGGDEFTILLHYVAHSREPATVAKRLIDTLTEPIMLGSHEVKISSSIGITLYPDDGIDTETLNKNADIALYHAKRQGKNNFQFYSASMNKLAMERISMETKLRNVLARDELSIYYQPQVDLLTGEVVGLEALLRWKEPAQGFITPDIFVPIAEECRLITPISDWVLHKACRQNKAWQQAGLKPVTISVNISGIQLSRQNLQAVVADCLRDSGLAPNYLELELTETSLLEEQDQAIRTLNELNALGVGIALDDFGTGYSSLSYLKELPISHLKIDRAFVRDIHTNPNDAAIVAAIIAMARTLGLRVTAEGVEHKLQLDFLRERKCDVVQGFLLSKPVMVSEVEYLLKNGLQLNAEYFHQNSL